MKKRVFNPLLAVAILSVTFLFVDFKAGASPNNPNTDWMMDAKYGIFVHHLYGLNDLNGDWNATVNEFNVTTFANDAEAAGAGYVIFTSTAATGYANTPNATFDSYTGYAAGTRRSTRDLIDDLSAALDAKGIKLILYIPSDGANQDPRSNTGLNWTGDANPTFIARWSDVVEEWSLRYGTKIAGWYLDGAGYPGWEAGTNFAQIENAMRAGNADAILGFNHVNSTSVYEDYKGTESHDLITYPASRWINGLQWQILTYMGNWYGGASSTGANNRFSDEYLIDYIKKVNSNGGVVTLDARVNRNGSIAANHLQQLQTVKAHIKGSATPPPEPGTNLAAGKSSSLKSNINGAVLSPLDGIRSASSAVDGYISTWAQPEGEYAWTLETDLGSIQAFNRVVIQFAPPVYVAEETFEGHYATEYDVKVSSNGTDWTTVVSVAGGKGGKADHIFSSINARYIRVVGLRPDTTNQTGKQMGIAELRVYSGNWTPTPAPTPTPTPAPVNMANDIFVSGSAISNIDSSPLPENYNARGGRDGNMSTIAQAANEYAWTYQLGFPERRLFNKVVVSFAPGLYATHYEIRVSDNLADWTVVGSVSGGTGQPATFTFDPVYKRYLRVVALKPDGPGQTGTQMAISELEVYHIPPSTPNIALNKTASFISNINGASLPPAGGWVAAYGIDGSMSTQAQAGNEYAYTYQVDLGGSYEFNKAVVKFPSGNFATASLLQTSVDGTTWSLAATVTGTTAGTKIIEFPAVIGRYVRLVALKPDGAGQPGAQMAISEFELYNAAESEITREMAHGKTASLVDNSTGAPLSPSGGNVAANAVDGDIGTTAQAGGVYPWTLQVDMGTVQSVNQVKVVFGTGLYATEYNIKLSTDGTNWTTVATVTGSQGGTIVNMLERQNARYVRFAGTKPDGGGQTGVQMSIAELYVYDSDLAYKKPSRLLNNTTGADLGPVGGVLYAVNAVDGNTATTAQAGGQYAWTLETDLGTVKPGLNKAVVTFGAGLYATEYDVKVSSDRTNWTTVATVTGGTGGTNEHAFTAVDGRYVRVVAVKPDASGQTGTQMSIAELKVYND